MVARRRREPMGWMPSLRMRRRSVRLSSTRLGSSLPHFVMYSGISFFPACAGGGGGGVEVAASVFTSSRAAAVVERCRTAVRATEALVVCCTHRRHAVNCLVTDAIAIYVDGWAWLRSDVRDGVEVGLPRQTFFPTTPPRQLRDASTAHVSTTYIRHGFHEDVCANARRHFTIEQIIHFHPCMFSSHQSITLLINS